MAGGMLSVASLVVVGLAAVSAETSMHSWQCNAEPLKFYDVRMGEPKCWFADKFDTKAEVNAWAKSLEVEGEVRDADSKDPAYTVSARGIKCSGVCGWTSWWEESWCFVSPEDDGGRASTAWGMPLPGIKWDYCRPMHDGEFLGQIEMYFNAKRMWQEHIDMHPRLRNADRLARGLVAEVDEEPESTGAKERLRMQEAAQDLALKHKKFNAQGEAQQKRDAHKRAKAAKFAETQAEMEKFFHFMQESKKRLCAGVRRKDKRRKERKDAREAKRAKDEALLSPEQKKMEAEGGIDESSPCFTGHDEEYIESAMTGISQQMKKAGSNGLMPKKKDPVKATQEAGNTIKESMMTSADREKHEKAKEGEHKGPDEEKAKEK
jgi:hypothetical protein